jgi:hypothetical protein
MSLDFKELQELISVLEYHLKEDNVLGRARVQQSIISLQKRMEDITPMYDNTPNTKYSSESVLN